MLKKLQLHRLPFKVKLFWASIMLYMFKGFGKTYKDDLILYVELKRWVETKGKPTSEYRESFIKDLVSFGNYLLSEKRKQRFAGIGSHATLGERLSEVHDADIQNWIDDIS